MAVNEKYISFSECIAAVVHPVTMERHVTFVEPPGKPTTQWLHRQRTSPALFPGVHLAPPILRRPVTKGQSTCGAGDKEQQIEREATQLFEKERSR